MGVTAPLFSQKFHIISALTALTLTLMLETCHIYDGIFSRTPSPIHKILLSLHCLTQGGDSPPFFTKIPYNLSSDGADAHFNGRNLPHLLLHYLQDTIPYPKNIAFIPLPHSWGLQPPFFTKKHIFSALTPLTLNLMLETCHIYYCIISRKQSPIQKILLSTPLPHSWGLQPPFFPKNPYNLSSDPTDAHFNGLNLPHLLLHYIQDTIPYP